MKNKSNVLRLVDDKFVMEEGAMTNKVIYLKSVSFKDYDKLRKAGYLIILK